MRLLNAYDSRNLEQFAQIINEVHPDSEKVANATALQVICRQHKPGDEAYVKLLLEKGANPNHSPWGENHHDRIIATTLGAYSGLGGRKETLIKILKMLLDYGAEVNYLVLKRNYKKLPANVTELLPNSLLHDAMNRALDLREPEIIALLVKNGIQDHDNNFSSSPHLTVLQDLKGRIKKYNPHDRARYQKTAEDICLLLEKGYPAYAEKQQRLAEIKEAEERQKLAELQRQQEEKLRIQAEEKRKMEEAQRQLEHLRLQAVQQKASVQQVEKVPAIQEHDYNARRLFNLFNSKNLSAFKALLESGYKPDMEPNSYGSVLTNICLCSTEGSEKYVDLLLQHGANPNKVNQSKYCPLKGVLYSLGHENTYETRSKIVELLLKHDANPNYPSQELYCGAYAPLHRAVDFSISISKENTKIIELLLQYGASTQTKDKHGHTPLEHLDHDIRNNRMAPYNNPSRYVNYENIKSLLELGYEAHQSLIREQEAERKRQQEEMAQADNMLCRGEGNDELAQFFDSHKPPPLSLEEVKQTEEQRLTKIQESQHHLFSADALNQCKKEARSQLISDTVSSVIECTPQSIQESLMRGKPVAWTNCDKKAQKINFSLLDSRLKLCESQEAQRQHNILKEEIDKHVEKFFKNFLRICELLGFAADGGLTSEQYNLVIEKMEEERAEKIKMLESLDLSGRRVEGYGSIGSHVKMSVMLSNFFDLDNDSFRKKIMEAAAGIKKQKDDQKMRHYTPAGGSGCGWGGLSFANFLGKDYDPTTRSSLSEKESSSSCSGGGNSTRRCNDNSYTKSSVSSDSRRGRSRATGGAITIAYNNTRKRSSSAPPGNRSRRSNGGDQPCGDFLRTQFSRAFFS